MMNKNLIIGVVVIIILAVVAYFFLFGTFGNGLNTDMPGGTNSGSNINSNNQETTMTEGYQGNVLAGSVTPYIEFNKADYDKAVREGKVVFLNFYANWCPTCRAEEPDLFEGFNSLDVENVVAFRVNFKDSDTDQAETDLAKQFEIPYQHSKVVLLNGVVLDKQIATAWSAAQLIEQVNKHAE